MVNLVYFKIVLYIISIFLTNFQNRQIEKPNVIVLLVDDMNYWVEPHGYKLINTPNISNLAINGITFTNAHATIPLCNPSRASLFLGLSPRKTDIKNFSQRINEFVPNSLSFVQHFKNNGYLTFGAGKTYHWREDNDSKQWTDYRYFDDNLKPNHIPAHGIDSIYGPNKNFDWAAIEADLEKWKDSKITNYGIEKIIETDDPLLLVLGYHLPHLPFYIPKQFYDIYSDKAITNPDLISNDLDDITLPNKRYGDSRTHKALLDNSLYYESLKHYMGAISFIDFQIGKLIKAVENKDDGRETIIIFTSDHGFMTGEKDIWKKEVLWRKSTSIPFIVRVTGKNSQKNTKVNIPVSLLDVYPTIIDFSELPKPSNLDGKSLLNKILIEEIVGDTISKKTDNFVLVQHPWHAHYSIKNEEYSFIRYDNKITELYDIVNDKPEWENLALNEDYNTTLEILNNKLDSVLSIKHIKNQLKAPSKFDYKFNSEKNQIIIEWNHIDSAPYYQVDYSNTKSFIYYQTEDFILDNSYTFDIDNGNHKYLRIKSKNPWYSSEWSEIIDLSDTIVSSKRQEIETISINLLNNYPNPFDNVTTIRFSVESNYPVKLEIFSIDGLKIMTLIDNEVLPKGEYSVDFNRRNFASGNYFYRLSTENKSISRFFTII